MASSSSSSSHAPVAEPPPKYYEYKERLLVSPVVKKSNTSSSSTVHWFLRFETHQQQLVATTRSSSPESPPFFFFTPLSPSDIPALLQSYQAVRILIQVSNAASSSFPASPLDTATSAAASIQPLGSSEGRLNATINTGDHDHGDGVIHSPAGVRIAVDFFVQENDGNDGSNKNEDSNDSSNLLVDRFASLLQEISARRWVLASLASIQEPRRLHRFIHQEEVVAVMPYNNNNNNNIINSTVVKMRMRRHRLSITLPMDGHALSAEAMVSFTTAFNPCAASASRRNNNTVEFAHAPDLVESLVGQSSRHAKCGWRKSTRRT
jgi:hypothetical protein